MSYRDVNGVFTVEFPSGNVCTIPDFNGTLPTTGGMPSVFNVKDYGAVGDGVTNDLPAFQAALDDMGSYVNTDIEAQTLYVPQGNFYLDGDLVIERAMHVLGCGSGAGFSGSRITFSAYHGVKAFGQHSAPHGGEGSGWFMEGIDLYGAHGPGSGIEPENHPKWQALHAYVVGDKIVPGASRAARPADANGYGGSSFEYYYECVRAGTSDTTEPVVWGQLIHYGNVWQANHDYYAGNIVRPTVSKLPNQDLFFICTTPAAHAGPGVSGSSEPSFNLAIMAGDTVTDGAVVWTAFDPRAKLQSNLDGTVVWVTKTAAGIFTDTRGNTDRVYIEGFLTAGLHVQGNLSGIPLSAVSLCRFANMYVRSCGGGVLVRGQDGNASVFENIGVGLNFADDREFGFADRSFLGCRFYSCFIEGCKGPGFLVTSSASTGGIYGMYVEGTGGDVVGLFQIYSFHYAIVGGTIGSSNLSSDSVFTGWAARLDWRGVGFQDSTTAQTIQLLFDKNTLESYSVPEDGGSHATTYDTANNNFVRARGAATGWGWTASSAADGPAFPVLRRGFLLGTTKTSQRFVGAKGYNDDNTNGDLREASRLVGDIFFTGADALTDDGIGVLVTKAGYVPADTWAVNNVYGTASWNRPLPGGTGAGGSASAHVEPTVPNGYVYRCTKNGRSSLTTEPSWPTTVATNVARTFDTSTGMYVVVGDFVRPLTPNSHIYEVTSIAGDVGAYTGIVEPTYPTSNGTNVVQGVITYTCRADNTATWVADNGTIWTCIGTKAVTQPFGRQGSGLTIANTGTGTLNDVSSVEATDSVTWAGGILFTGAGTQLLTSIAGGVDGREITIIGSQGVATVTLENYADAVSNGHGTSTNRIATPGGTNFTVDAAVKLRYIGSLSRWYVVR